MSGYFSYGQQGAHYFDRPHRAVATAPVEGPAAWRGEDVCARDDWRETLDGAAVEEIDSAVAAARATGKPLGELSVGDFPLPTLGKRIAAWTEQVHRGRGVQVISGVPVSRWSRETSELFFWCLGLHMGRPGAQSPRNDLLGHITDTGEDAADPFVRKYRTASNIAYHCDGADIVGLLCLAAAKRGGASCIVSSVTVYNELLASRPDLAARLYEPFLLDLRNEDASGELLYIPVPPCRFDGERLRTFYHSDYFRSVERFDGAPRFTDEERTLLDLYEEIASRPDLRLDMELAPGDIQFISNHTVLHARTDYEDFEETERKRHLLRLWLSVE